MVNSDGTGNIQHWRERITDASGYVNYDLAADENDPQRADWEVYVGCNCNREDEGPGFRLPDEMWSVVFSFCHTVQDPPCICLVCKKWHELWWKAVDPSACDSRMLVLASKNGRADLVKLFLGHPNADPSARKYAAIRWATKNGYADVVAELLADDRVDPAAGNNCLIWVASQNGCTAVVKLLLARADVDPGAQKNLAIIQSSKNGHANVVRELLRHPRVDPSAQENRALCLASKNCHVHVAELLLQDERVDPNCAIRFSWDRTLTRLLRASPRFNPVIPEKKLLLILRLAKFVFAFASGMLLGSVGVTFLAWLVHPS